MPLRKPPRRTPRLLAAARHDAQHSTGPRRAAGKQNSKLNALKHGQRASPENHRQVMLALAQTPTDADVTRRGEAPPRPYNVATPNAGVTTANESKKLNERTGNVLENKGMLWKTAATGLNLLEDKGDACIIRECS